MANGKTKGKTEKKRFFTSLPNASESESSSPSLPSSSFIFIPTDSFLEPPRPSSLLPPAMNVADTPTSESLPSDRVLAAAPFFPSPLTSSCGGCFFLLRKEWTRVMGNEFLRSRFRLPPRVSDDTGDVDGEPSIVLDTTSASSSVTMATSLSLEESVMAIVCFIALKSPVATFFIKTFKCNYFVFLVVQRLHCPLIHVFTKTL